MQDKPSLEDTLALMRDLRARCEWDRAQTHASLRPYLIEEAHEVDDALRAGDTGMLREELGDLLLQVLFHSVIAEEHGAFDLHDVAASLIAKMRRRHPHLYGSGAREPWETLKAKKRKSIADGLPVDLPALHRAHRLPALPLAVAVQVRVARVHLGDEPGADVGEGELAALLGDHRVEEHLEQEVAELLA